MHEVFSDLKDEVQSTLIFQDAYKKVRNLLYNMKRELKSEANNKPGRKKIQG